MTSGYPFPPDATARIRAEFTEMPCMRLTVAQAARLFGLEQPDCRRLLTNLVHAQFLVRDDGGQYHSRSAGQAIAERSGLPLPLRQRLPSAGLKPASAARARA